MTPEPIHHAKTKLIITVCLAVVLALLLANQATQGGKQPPAAATTSTAATPSTSDLRSELQQSLDTEATQALAVTMTQPLVPQPLPRDPFAFRPPATPRAAPEPPRPSQAAPAPQHRPPVEERLRLKATAIDRYGASAFINDQVLTEGQAILGYTVVNIAAGQVELVHNGKKVVLRLADGGKP